MSAAYPNALLNWTALVNGATVQASDMNTLAAEIDATEQFVGLNPQNESQPLSGATSQFSSLSARVSQAMLQTGHPYIQLSAAGTPVYQNASATTANLSQLGMNSVTAGWPNYVAGGSIVIQDAGVWEIEGSVVWPYITGGWVTHTLMFNNTIMRRDVFSYDQFPTSGANAYGERFLSQNGYTETFFLGKVTAGTVVSIFVGNMSNTNPVPITSASLSAYFLRP